MIEREMSGNMNAREQNRENVSKLPRFVFSEEKGMDGRYVMTMLLTHKASVSADPIVG